MSTIDFDPADTIRILPELTRGTGWSSPMKLELTLDGDAIKLAPITVKTGDTENDLTITERLLRARRVGLGVSVDEHLDEMRSEI